jgi:putative membrane protein
LDSRFLQANERTLLAWVRTSLGLLALGFVIARFRLLADLDAAHVSRTSAVVVEWTGISVTALAPLVLGVGIARYTRTHDALVRGDPAPTSRFGPALVAYAVAAASVAVVVALVASR